MGIWEQLNTRTLFGSEKATASEVNAQTKDIHLEEKNRTLLTDTVLINESLMRDGGVIPGTQKIVTVTSDTSEDYVELIKPEPGECWTLQSAHLSRAGASGSSVTSFFFYDGTTRAQWFYISGSSNDLILTSDDNWPMYPLYFSDSCWGLFQGTNGTTMGTMTIEAVFIRVR